MVWVSQGFLLVGRVIDGYSQFLTELPSGFSSLLQNQFQVGRVSSGRVFCRIPG